MVIMDTLSSHSSYLLQQLQEQRIQGLLCDCMLVVKGVCFKAHKNVLAAFSSYFRSLFQNSPSQKNDVFHLVIQDVSGIGQILDYMYTSHLDINQDNVQALLDIAQCLQVPNIQTMCNAFLKPCPPPVETPSFPLPGVLTPEHTCLLGGGLPPDVELPCPSSDGKRPGISSDLDPSKRFPFSVPQSSFNCDAGGSSHAPVEKQLVHGYKLRNFYSKQYFKQSAAQTISAASNQGPSPLLLVEELPCQLGVGQGASHTSVCSGSTVQPTSSCTSTLVEKNTGLLLTPVEPATSVSDPTDSLLNKPMRPKKAVYLKKYNYLRSQQALEEMCAEAVSEPVLKDMHQEESPVQNDASEAPVRDPEDGRGDVQETETDTLVPNATPVDQEEPSLKTVSDPPQQTGHRQYCCAVCGKIFKHPSNLELHKRSHTGEKPFQCNICGKHFSQAGNLQTHLRRHSGEKPYICEQCGKSFAAAGDVQRHIVVHTGERPHLCDICGRGFSNFSNLKEHKKTHTTDKTFTCDQCGKSFNMHRKLLKHKVRHAGEKPHRCETCGKCFVGSGDLLRHVRSHTGERPYLCDACGKSFTRSALLRRHTTLHCKGMPGRSPVTDGPDPASSSEEPASLSEPVVTRDTPTEQPFPGSVMPHAGAGTPAVPSVTLARPKPSVETPPPAVHLTPGSITTATTTSTATSLPELRTLMSHHLLASTHQDKHPPMLASESEHSKQMKQQLPQEAVYSPFVATGAVTVEMGAGLAGRPYLPLTDRHCGSFTVPNRPSNGSYRAAEGPIISSVTSWGMAMKTLHSDNDMEL